MSLLETWAGFEPTEPPYVLPVDREHLRRARSATASLVWSSWENACTDPSFGAPGDSRLHLGLLPMPFSGDLHRATIYLLLLNPGFDPTDYYGEYVVPEFRAERLANLLQDFEGQSVPFVGLNPQFAWHGGLDYWHGKLRGVIAHLSTSSGVSFARARAELAKRLAVIELFPYYSESFADADRWLRDLRSVHLARQFVQDVVIPRVRSGSAIAIVTRQARLWNVPDTIPGVTVYTAQQARAAHLTPDSPGGAAILRHLTAGRPRPDRFP